MVDWEKELREYIVRKMKNRLGLDVNPSEIKTVSVDAEVDFKILEIEELAMIYAFAIMKEDFEEAKEIADELKTRDCIVEIDVNDLEKTGVINVYKQPETSVVFIDIKLKVLPDGMIVDFEKQNF